MMRRRNWDIRLCTWAAAQLGRPYVWGETDCLALALGALQAQYPALPPLPIFPTQAAALRAIAADPGVIGATLYAAGARAVAQVFLQAGDLVELPDPREPGLAIAVWPGWCLLTTPATGVGRIRISELPAAAIAWRFPHG